MLPPDTTFNEDEDFSPEQAAQELEAAEQERKDILNRLGQQITDKFVKRASERKMKELEWLKCQQLYNNPLQGSSLDLPDRPFDSNRDNSKTRPEPNIVRIKCDTAIANSVSMQFSGGTEKNWNLFPPANERNPQTIEQCRGMEREIEAQLSATQYDMKCRRAMEDRVIYGTGVVKGPVNTGRQSVKYVREADGIWVPRVRTEYAPNLEYVPIWRYYPDMGVTDFNESDNDIEIHPMTAIDLSRYAEHDGFDKEAIMEILQGSSTTEGVKPTEYNDTLVNLTAEAWSRNPYLYKDRYVVIEYHGPVSYDDLNKLGLSPTYDSPSEMYFGEVWVCCGKVIRMELENIEGHFETPYARSVWKRDPSSPFGFGHPLLLSASQQVVTATYHMILDNAALTSGTQVAMYKKFIQPIDGDYTIRPNKVWLLTDPNADIDKAIKFFNPTNNIANIMPVLQLARQFADEESSTSGVASGLPSPELADTATGAREMRQASTTLLDFLSEDWDDEVTEKIIRRWYAWNMQYGKNEAIKGDYVIDVKSSSEFKNKAMYVRELERLSMEVAQNPQMADAINVDELYRARLALMHLPSAAIVRTPEEIAQAQAQRQQQPDPKMIELQIKSKEADTADKLAQLKEKELKFQVVQQQQREQWEHLERMSANEARMAEAQAMVLRSQAELQVEFLQLAQKNEQFMAKILTDKELAALTENARVFVESMKVQQKAQESKLVQQELDLAEKTGEGI